MAHSPVRQLDLAVVNPPPHHRPAATDNGGKMISVALRPAYLAAVLALVTLSDVAQAEPVAEFYKGKTLTVIVPIGPGGTYDLYGRLGAKIMEKHLPGNPNVITQLMTGAGGAVAAAYLDKVAAKDGTVLLSMHASSPQNQVLGVTGDQYDLRNFLMIGQFVPLNSSLTVWRPTSPAVTIQDAMKKEVVLGSTGAGSYQYQLPALMNVLLGTKFKVILGFKSVSEENIAMERGEIHGRGGTIISWEITEPHWVKDNKIAHLVQIGARREKSFENVPLVQDLTTNPDHKKAFMLIGAASQLGRSLVGTPGIPPDRAKAIRTAFEKGMKDPEILAQAKAWKLDINPISGEDMEKTVMAILDTPQPVVDLVKKALNIEPKKAK
jgi:tripartite-type tricarboxylate transporter receptor subunit TctC